MSDGGRPDLEAALGTFERVAANVVKAERVWAEIAGEQLSADEHDDRIRVFVDLTAALPAIDGFRVDAVPMSKTERELARWDAGEVDEPEFYVRTEEQIARPGAELRQ
jgi:hypothetical protein